MNTYYKHTAYDLAQMRALPLELKVIMTKKRIQEWYEHWDGLVYISFSGGKDSTVLKHIVDRMYTDVPSVFVNTGLEYPEIQKFALSQKNVVAIRPDVRFDEVIIRYGYPVISKTVSQNVSVARRNPNGLVMKNLFNPSTQGIYAMYKWSFLLSAPFGVSGRCCDIMKKAPFEKYSKQTGRKGIIGTLASESRLRYNNWLKTGCNAFENKKPISQPLSFWTEQDILYYIKSNNIPYCSVYGDIVVSNNDGIPDSQVNIIDCIGCYDETDKLTTTGCDRTGCIFCMFGCHLEKEPNRFQKLKRTHPRQYEYCIGGGEMIDGKWQPNKYGLGLYKVLDYIGVKYD